MYIFAITARFILAILFVTFLWKKHQHEGSALLLSFIPYHDYIALGYAIKVVFDRCTTCDDFY